MPLPVCSPVLPFNECGLCCSLFSFLCSALHIIVCPLVIFSLAIVSPSIYGFWLPLWHLQTVLSIIVTYRMLDRLSYEILFLRFIHFLRTIFPELVVGLDSIFFNITSILLDYLCITNVHCNEDWYGLYFHLYELVCLLHQNLPILP